LKSKNMQYMIAFVMSIVVAVSISACGTQATPTAASTDSTAVATSDSSTTAAPSTDATAAPTADTSSAVMGQAVFTNTGSIDICQLFLSHVSKSEWGPNQLPTGQKIVAGDKFTVTNVPVGTYDAKAVGCDGTGEAVIQLDVK